MAQVASPRRAMNPTAPDVRCAVTNCGKRGRVIAVAGDLSRNRGGRSRLASGRTLAYPARSSTALRAFMVFWVRDGFSWRRKPAGCSLHTPLRQRIIDKRSCAISWR